MESGVVLRGYLFGFVVAVGLIFQGPAFASTEDNSEPGPERMGFVEWVVMKDTGLRMKARLDTGAKTSSLHATDVEGFEKDGDDWVRFRLPLDDHNDIDSPENEGVVLEFERPVERTVLIKRKGADSQKRFVVEMEFCIAGKVHQTEFSLTDRGHFKYPALLGRRFMGDDNVLVDSAESFIAEAKCEYNAIEKIAELPEARS
ncbi:ATP-dependent zinc protease [Marinobacter sp.]|uniref:ATP-dependent zinc protease family protein n=1 Tax=Marinobacter sp. TaxID=50741 RepID=UPI003561EE0E